eukprot:TRINITY_DN39745_c0_g1_i1.p1 TRINITY_DN39745_c0_g1~~TRINITY_DN39745_c0_g1_i1.p1  ORF type:complete len:324 (-),score=63.99 TRINITY_DN39745_c0_g1_i1:10-981(-)
MESRAQKATYGAAADAGALPRPVPRMRRIKGMPDTTQLCKALLNIIGPPMLFLTVFASMSFRVHFTMGKATWGLALLSFVPYYIAYRFEQRALSYRTDRSWPRLSKFLFFVAAFLSVLCGALNYWYYGWPSYSIEGLRAYEDIDASEVSGQRLMDSGRVVFAEGSHVLTDLAMSYTEWETYCVAPITTNRGKQTKDTGLARYDMWAVGVGCCSRGETNFRCGDYADPEARQGIRLVDNSQLPYFHLAVQQAEAAYNLQVDHPMFFTWVKDSDKGLGDFFRIAFNNFIIGTMFHMGFNLVCVFGFIAFFAGSGKDTGLAALDEH